MHRIEKKQQLTSEICLVELTAEDIARAAHPGQFIILRIDEKGERFPLTLYEWDDQRGTVTVICQAVGVSTRKLCAMNVGDVVLDIAGPLGSPTDISGFQKVICVGGGVGTAETYPIAKAFKHGGSEVVGVIGFRNSKLVFCEEQMDDVCDRLFVTTDDGTYGRKGYVTDVLSELLEETGFDLVHAIGPVPMMARVAEVTEEKGIKTLVSLNSIMIDGTGMCGGCRLVYDGEVRFCCVDGPEFDAHKIDFEDLLKRQKQYSREETRAMERHQGKCKLKEVGSDERTKT